MRRRTIAIAGGALLVVVVLITGLLVLRGDGDRAATTTTATAGPTVTSPYDLTEAGEDVDLGSLSGAKFASLLLETPDGLTSYMVAAGQDAFAALADAVAKATEVQEPAPDATESLTFVMPDRVTVTFALDVASGLIAREGTVWRIDGDLDSLVRAVTEQAPPST
ncbi:MAG: hypothetical protein ACYC5Q_13575 [Thermoleophilia bacterium]